MDQNLKLSANLQLKLIQIAREKVPVLSKIWGQIGVKNQEKILMSQIESMWKNFIEGEVQKKIKLAEEVSDLVNELEGLCKKFSEDANKLLEGTKDLPLLELLTRLKEKISDFRKEHPSPKQVKPKTKENQALMKKKRHNPIIGVQKKRNVLNMKIVKKNVEEAFDRETNHKQTENSKTKVNIQKLPITPAPKVNKVKSANQNVELRNLISRGKNERTGSVKSIPVSVLADSNKAEKNNNRDTTKKTESSKTSVYRSNVDRFQCNIKKSTAGVEKESAARVTARQVSASAEFCYVNKNNDPDHNQLTVVTPSKSPKTTACSAIAEKPHKPSHDVRNFMARIANECAIRVKARQAAAAAMCNTAGNKEPDITELKSPEDAASTSKVDTKSNRDFRKFIATNENEAAVDVKNSHSSADECKNK